MDSFLIPDYSQMLDPLVSVGPRGEGVGELNGPRGVAYREESKEIFIADERNSRIQIFNVSGKYIYSFGTGELEKPSNLLIDGQWIYVTDWGWLRYSLFKYDLKTLKLVKKIGKNSFDASKDFNLLRQPEMGPDGSIYIPDNNNNRICVFSKQLERVSFLNYVGLDNPVDIKFRGDKLYVLNNNNLFCLHIFTLEGVKLGSIISRGESTEIDAQVLYPNYFLFDSENRIIVSDFLDHSIKVFSYDGGAMECRIGGEGSGALFYPMGFRLTSDGKMIVVSSNEKFGLQIF